MVNITLDKESISYDNIFSFFHLFTRWLAIPFDATLMIGIAGQLFFINIKEKFEKKRNHVDKLH